MADPDLTALISGSVAGFKVRFGQTLREPKAPRSVR